MNGSVPLFPLYALVEWAGIKLTSCAHRDCVLVSKRVSSLVTSAPDGGDRHRRRLRVTSGAIAPGPALEGAPRFRPKVDHK
jgi:hypothetical protein